MASDSVTILCQWNGKITSCSRGVSYEGGTSKLIKVSSRIDYNDLVDKLYSVTGFKKLVTSVKITCRYPISIQEYKAVPVEDSDSLSIVFDLIKQPGINGLEFYLEATPIEIDEQTDDPQSTLDGNREVKEGSNGMRKPIRKYQFAEEKLGEVKDSENSISGLKRKRESVESGSSIGKPGRQDNYQKKGTKGNGWTNKLLEDGEEGKRGCGNSSEDGTEGKDQTSSNNRVGKSKDSTLGIKGNKRDDVSNSNGRRSTLNKKVNDVVLLLLSTLPYIVTGLTSHFSFLYPACHVGIKGEGYWI